MRTARAISFQDQTRKEVRLTRNINGNAGTFGFPRGHHMTSSFKRGNILPRTSFDVLMDRKGLKGDILDASLA